MKTGIQLGIFAAHVNLFTVSLSRRSMLFFSDRETHMRPRLANVLASIPQDTQFPLSCFYCHFR
jgi:hypothetical protein